MKLNKLFILFILFFVPYICYADTYTEYTSVGNISCSILSTNAQNCLIGLYSSTNSHATLCNVSAPLYYGCKIDVSTSIGTSTKVYTIPIVFSTNNCQNPFMYLYKERNSHVSLVSGNYPICLSSYYQNVLSVSTTAGDFMLGLYNTESSHVSTTSNTPIALFLNRTDVIFPNVSYNDTRDYITVPIAINSTFFDNKYLYYCNIDINGRFVDISNNCRYKSTYSYVYNITESDCPPGDYCYITYVGVDLAGNLYKRVKRYFVLNPCLRIVIGSGLSSLILVGFNPYYLRVELENPLTCVGNFSNITLNINGEDCKGIILLNGGSNLTYYIPKLANGDTYTTTIRIDPLRSGRCTLSIIAKGTVDGLNENRTYSKDLPVSVAIRTSLGFLIVSEPSILYGILLIISLILLL